MLYFFAIVLRLQILIHSLYVFWNNKYAISYTYRYGLHVNLIFYMSTRSSKSGSLFPIA